MPQCTPKSIYDPIIVTGGYISPLPGQTYHPIRKKSQSSRESRASSRGSRASSRGSRASSARSRSRSRYGRSTGSQSPVCNKCVDALEEDIKTFLKEDGECPRKKAEKVLQAVESAKVCAEEEELQRERSLSARGKSPARNAADTIRKSRSGEGPAYPRMKVVDAADTVTTTKTDALISPKVGTSLGGVAGISKVSREQGETKKARKESVEDCRACDQMDVNSSGFPMKGHAGCVLYILEVSFCPFMSTKKKLS